MSMTKIATIVVGAGGSSSIDFTGIPQNFTDLMLVYSTRPGSTDSSWIQRLKLNDITSIGITMEDGEDIDISVPYDDEACMCTNLLQEYKFNDYGMMIAFNKEIK